MHCRFLLAILLLVPVETLHADDKGMLARAFHVDPDQVIINLPPRPDAWPGAIFTKNLRLPIVYGRPDDPAIRHGAPVQIDEASGLDLTLKLQVATSPAFDAAAEAEHAADVVLTFQDARISDMPLDELRKHILASHEAMDAAKTGQNPVIVIRSYSGRPMITITRKSGGAVSAWAKIKRFLSLGGEAAAKEQDRISYSAGREIIFAFETMQASFDPSDLVKGNPKVQLTSLPDSLFAFRQEHNKEAFGYLAGHDPGAVRVGMEKPLSPYDIPSRVRALLYPAR